MLNCIGIAPPLPNILDGGQNTSLIPYRRKDGLKRNARSTNFQSTCDSPLKSDIFAKDISKSLDTVTFISLSLSFLNAIVTTYYDQRTAQFSAILLHEGLLICQSQMVPKTLSSTPIHYSLKKDACTNSTLDGYLLFSPANQSFQSSKH